MSPTPSPAYGPVDVPIDCWGLDTCVAGVLTDDQLRALAAFDLGSLGISGVTGRPRVLWGYCPLPGNHSAWDWTSERLRAACDAGLLAGMVQHCPSGMWSATAQRGADAGHCAADYAAYVGYPVGCHLVMDDEAVANPGPDAYADVAAWCWTVKQQTPPCVYEGYDPGLSPAEEYEQPCVDRYWGAVGPWDVATRGVCCRQGRTVRINGVVYDLDHFFADKLGGALRLMGRVDLWAPTEPPPSNVA